MTARAYPYFETPGCCAWRADTACRAPSGWRVYAPMQPGISENRYC